MSKVIFLPEHEEILIESVRKNPILYDSADSKHKDIILKDEIWKDIGLKIGKSGDECKKRWKNIRDTYNRNKRKLGTGSARTSKKKWPLAAHISFLDGVECERSSSSNATMIDESFSHEEDEESIEAIQEEKTANTNEGFSMLDSV
ncbi:transcription factor Adf-1-like [Melanaphis sacchari]|uniref:transcription factor Adf-1-like n=1 Tax=Melanaphis sacchari TaxID=742174 RepID=UPI000DC15171|nr:transcription factor Adf-1-like [Melanaphis sacchari]